MQQHCRTCPYPPCNFSAMHQNIRSAIPHAKIVPRHPPGTEHRVRHRIPRVRNLERERHARFLEPLKRLTHPHCYHLLSRGYIPRQPVCYFYQPAPFHRRLDSFGVSLWGVFPRFRVIDPLFRGQVSACNPLRRRLWFRRITLPEHPGCFDCTYSRVSRVRQVFPGSGGFGNLGGRFCRFCLLGFRGFRTIYFFSYFRAGGMPLLLDGTTFRGNFSPLLAWSHSGRLTPCDFRCCWFAWKYAA